MGLIWDFIKASAFSDSLNDKKKDDLEKEMDLYGLEEVEREFVRRGDYEPYNFEDVSLEDLEDMKNNDCFYVYSLEEISKKEMVERIHDLMNYHMFRYYDEIFKTEYLNQKYTIDELIEKRKIKK